MDLTQLRYFERVSALKSFSKAAAELRVAQPALSRRVRLLEEELGVQLLIRYSRGVFPTEAGVSLSKGAASILQLAKSVKDNVIAGNASPTGTLRLGYVPSLGNLMLTPLVVAYAAKFPNVRLHVASAYSHDLLEWLLADRIDIALMGAIEDNPALSLEPLFNEDLWVVTPRGTKRRTFAIEDLAPFRLIRPAQSNSLTQLLDIAALKAGVKLNVIAEVEGIDLIKGLVRKKVGVQITPYTAVENEVTRGQFGGGPLRGINLPRVIARRLDRPVSNAMTEMIAMARAQALDVIARSSPYIRKPDARIESRRRKQGPSQSVIGRGQK